MRTSTRDFGAYIIAGEDALLLCLVLSQSVYFYFHAKLEFLFFYFISLVFLSPASIESPSCGMSQIKLK